jgi:AraC-like DNA-binding protein
MLYPTGRSATIHFAALDYSHPERISYAFRLLTKGQDSSKEWNYVGQSRSATLLDLEPGTYRLEIRSTNADGQWTDNIRQLTIIVKPTFWEAWYGQLLIILLIFGIFAAIIYTLLYIRRIKRQQRETLEKYLAIIEVGGKNFDVRENQQLQEAPLTSLSAPLTSEIDPMLQRVMQFVEDNISNSDANVGDMADAAATSRSGLQRKLKQTMGVTPQDLMKEARIKRACQLLQQTDKSVSEIAYGCGFTDPKYFSRTFKQSTGTSPTDYRSQR